MNTETVDKAALNARIRAWAKDNNLPIGKRGPIHPRIIAAYQAEHGTSIEPQTA
jgi:hypothetical protein